MTRPRPLANRKESWVVKDDNEPCLISPGALISGHTQSCARVTECLAVREKLKTTAMVRKPS